jgi:hypothetical protein
VSSTTKAQSSCNGCAEVSVKGTFQSARRSAYARRVAADMRCTLLMMMGMLTLRTSHVVRVRVATAEIFAFVRLKSPTRKLGEGREREREIDSASSPVVEVVVWWATISAARALVLT